MEQDLRLQKSDKKKTDMKTDIKINIIISDVTDLP